MRISTSSAFLILILNLNWSFIKVTSAESPKKNSSAHFFILMVPDSKVESLRRRMPRQEDAGVGAVGGIAEAAVGPAANVGQILQGVLGGNLAPIFAGSTAFIPEGDFREGITEILQQTVAPAIQNIIREFNQNVQRHFNGTSTTPRPNNQNQNNNNQNNNNQLNNNNNFQNQNNQLQQQQNFNQFQQQQNFQQQQPNLNQLQQLQQQQNFQNFQQNRFPQQNQNFQPINNNNLFQQQQHFQQFQQPINPNNNQLFQNPQTNLNQFQNPINNPVNNNNFAPNYNQFLQSNNVNSNGNNALAGLNQIQKPSFANNLPIQQQPQPSLSNNFHNIASNFPGASSALNTKVNVSPNNLPSVGTQFVPHSAKK